MRTHQIESCAMQVIDRVMNGQPNEDSLCELKAEWPTDFPRAARQLAGHANAARNQHILWIIGIDEKAHAIRGASHAQFADWQIVNDAADLAAYCCHCPGVADSARRRG